MKHLLWMDEQDIKTAIVEWVQRELGLAVVPNNINIDLDDDNKTYAEIDLPKKEQA